MGGESYRNTSQSLASSLARVHRFKEAIENFESYFSLYSVKEIYLVNKATGFIYPFVKYYQCALLVEDNALQSRLREDAQKAIEYLNHTFKDEYIKFLNETLKVYKESSSSGAPLDIQKYENFKSVFYD